VFAETQDDGNVQGHRHFYYTLIILSQFLVNAEICN